MKAWRALIDGKEYKAMDGEMVKIGNLEMLAPKPGVCPFCAVNHEPDSPHDQQSLYWQYRVYAMTGGRYPSWKDAMAHCESEVVRMWVEALKGMGIDIEREG